MAVSLSYGSVEVGEYEKWRNKKKAPFSWEYRSTFRPFIIPSYICIVLESMEWYAHNFWSRSGDRNIPRGIFADWPRRWKFTVADSCAWPVSRASSFFFPLHGASSGASRELNKFFLISYHGCSYIFIQFGYDSKSIFLFSNFLNFWIEQVSASQNFKQDRWIYISWIFINFTIIVYAISSI